MATHPSHKLLLSVLVVVGLLFAVAIAVSLNNDDNITSLAFIKPPELRNFMKDCRDNGGEFDVRPNSAPPIVVVCEYPDRTVEYEVRPK